MVAVIWLVPALLINIAWGDGIIAPWNLAAIGSIIGSAVFVEASAHARTWARSGLYLLLAALLFVNNAQIAFENASHRSDHRSDHRKTAMVAAKTQSSQRSQWSQGRAEAATVAGEAAPATIQSEIDALTSKEAGRWRASEQCNPVEIKSLATREFCAEVGKLRAKKAAAERRDELDAKIAKLDEKTEAVGEVPTSADPFADSVAAFISIFGVELSENSRRAIGAQKDVTRSITLELIATFGPSAWLLMVGGWMRSPVPAPAPAPAPEKRGGFWTWRRNRQIEANTSTNPEKIDMEPPPPEPAPAVALDDPFHRFLSEQVEEAPGINLPAGDAWKAWGAWCARNGLEIGSQKSFGTKMTAKFARESNNNRPRYLNIRVKSAKPALRVVG